MLKGEPLGANKGLVSVAGTAGKAPGAESAVVLSPNMMKCLQMPLLPFPKRSMLTSPANSSNFSLCMFPEGLGQKEVSPLGKRPGPLLPPSAWPEVNAQ